MMAAKNSTIGFSIEFSDLQVILSLAFQDCKHVALFYDSEEQKDDGIFRFVNEGLARGQLCIIGTMRLQDRAYLESLTSRVANYERHVKDGNLLVIDFIPFYEAALKRDITPYREVQRQLEAMLSQRKGASVRYVGEATGQLFKNKFFDACEMIESWWQQSRPEGVTTLCLFDRSLMTAPPFDAEKERIRDTHDIILNPLESSAFDASKLVTPVQLGIILKRLEEVTGKNTAEMLAEYLHLRDFNSKGEGQPYKIGEIGSGLTALLGEDAARVIIEWLKGELARLG